MMGFANGLPQHGINPDDDERKVGDLLWPVVKPLATALVEDEIDYMIEGVQLLPKHASELHSELDHHVKSCFVGYSKVDTLAKFHQIRSFGGGTDDWLKEYDDERTRKEVERLKAFSEYIEEECGKYDLEYFEISLDFEEAIEPVFRYFQG